MVRISKRSAEPTPIQNFVVIDTTMLPFRQPDENEIIFLLPIPNGFVAERFLKEEIEQAIIESRT